MVVEDRDGVLFVDGVAVGPLPKKEVAEEPPAETEVAAPPTALTGTLESVPLADLLLLLVASKKRGSLTIQSENNTAKFFVGNGGIIGGRHPTPGVEIATFLLNGGLITQQQLDAALAAMTAATPAAPRMLLPTLIETGVLSERAAASAVSQYVDIALEQVLTWSTGVFSFEPNPNVVGDADLRDPQAAYVVTPFLPSQNLERAAQLMGRPKEPETKPPVADPKAAPAASAANKKWALLAVPAILLGLGIGGILAYGYAQDRAECASTLASAQAELAKPPDCPVTECPPPPPCEAPADEVDEAETPRKEKRKRRKGKGKRKKGKAKEDDGTPDISHLLED